MLALLLFGEASDTSGASMGTESADRAMEVVALDSAHARLSALMDAPATARSMREGVRGIRRALAPALGILRHDGREPISELERSLASALAQLDDGGAALRADRSEFVLSALVPIASALDATRSGLDAAGR